MSEKTRDSYDDAITERCERTSPFSAFRSSFACCTRKKSRPPVFHLEADERSRRMCSQFLS